MLLTVVDEEEMSSTMVLKLKPVATKKIVAAPSSLKQKPMIIKPVRNNNFDHHKIAERVPIDDLKSGKFPLPEWADGLFDVTPEGQPRRRRRLNHLTTEEKALRRKLKNRVAAQNARDKKKSESENLKLENEQLLILVQKLEFEAKQRKNSMDQLTEENNILRSRLGLEPVPRGKTVSICSDSGCDSVVDSPGHGSTIYDMSGTEHCKTELEGNSGSPPEA
jgi:hypothetical protein